LQEVRRLEKDFLLQYENEGYQASYDYYVPLIQTHLGDILDTTTELRALIEAEAASTPLIEIPGETPEETPVETAETEQLDRIEQAVLDYQEAFVETATNDFATRGSQDSGLIGTINTSLGEMDEYAKAANDASVDAALDELNGAFKQYQLVTLPGHASSETFRLTQQVAVNSITERTTDLQNAILVSSNLTSPQKSNLRAQLSELTTTFNQLVEQDQEIAGEVADFQTASNEIEPVIENFTEAQLEADAQAQAGLATTQRTAQVAQMMAIILALIAGIGPAALITEGLTSQVAELKKVFRAAAIGNFDARAEVLSTDELGQTADGVNALLTQLTTLLARSETQLEQVFSVASAGMRVIDTDFNVLQVNEAMNDLTLTDEDEALSKKCYETFHNDSVCHTDNCTLAQILRGEERVLLEVDKSRADGSIVPCQMGAVPLRGQDGELIGIVEDFRDITRQREVMAGVEHAATEVTDASSSMAEVVQLMIDQAERSAQVAEEAAASAREGNQLVFDTVAAMMRIRENTQETARRIKRLGEVSQEIGESVRLIEELSDRTTVLALNASIQAAAAGEAGRGFAVVAEEVQRLAERATGATRQIEDLVKSIQAETNEAVFGIEDATREVVEGSQLADKAGERMIELNAVVEELANLIQHVAETTSHQTNESLGALTGMSQGLQASVSAFGLLPTEEHPGENGQGMLAVEAAGDGVHQREV
jgi:twitching motility protein PilJ